MTLKVSLRFADDCIVPMGILSNRERDMLFEYGTDFAAHGLNPSPFRLPVEPGVHRYDGTGGMETFGIFDASLPDGWGRRLMDAEFVKRSGRLPDVMERLSMIGGNGLGALVYAPEISADPPPDAWDLVSLASNAMDFDAGTDREVLPIVRQAGGSSGGARPKAFVGYNPVTCEVCAEAETLPAGFEHWLVKFNTRREGGDCGRREYAYYRLAIASGVQMSESRLVETAAGAFFATRRFDRALDGGRLHFASAASLLHADFRTPGDEYAVLFRLTDALTNDYRAKQELFRRVVLNVLAHNRDDHLKNFGFLMDRHGTWRLAPFYDFAYAEGPNGWQTLSVAGEGRNPGESDLLRLADEVEVKSEDAHVIIARVREALRQMNSR